jgi:hypothetical protein
MSDPRPLRILILEDSAVVVARHQDTPQPY